ncbi:helix-hairpin-helix domain-containing protein [Gellertiella hungarica]|uniref:Uncharacterized protein n=1 Tax=Gellertiella hungarica TaxID=1572859 RepID=A0A7W6NL34_9HYPH|nr:helix-hairpin-helix domain-containing protein [Gellertiella hungarica]MBB4066125.1 hypothetical protein [Gellertiella hungarica]
MPAGQSAEDPKPARRESDLVIRSPLPAWIIRALRAGGIKRMSLLDTLSDAELLAVPGIGKRALSIIRTVLPPHRGAGRRSL